MVFRCICNDVSRFAMLYFFRMKKEGMHMKRIVSLVLATILTVSFAGCAKKKESQATDSNERPVIRIGGLKGPTSMGMVKMLDDSEQGKTALDYQFMMAASADELTPKLLQGDLDILAVPANLGAVLANKSNGGVKMAAVNMLGAVYVVEKGGNEIQSLTDLKDQTIYATGKGSTPEYVLQFLLSQYGLDIEKDVNVIWKSEPTETVSAMATEDHAIAMIPQPFVTVAQNQIEDLEVRLDLNEEWDKLGVESKFITAGIVVNAKFADEHPDLVQKFLEEYADSTKYVKENVEDASILIEKYDIVKAPIAKKALPQCNIVCITGEEMKQIVNGNFGVLFDMNPASVGGTLPGDDFYLIYE